MTPTTLKGRPVLLVEVPESATDFVIDDELFFKAPFMGLPPVSHMKVLPAGNWSILLGLEPTEEECRKAVNAAMVESTKETRNGKLVDVPVYYYYDYETPTGYFCGTALESYASFIRSNGHEVGKTILLIKND